MSTTIINNNTEIIGRFPVSILNPLLLSHIPDVAVEYGVTGHYCHHAPKRKDFLVACKFTFPLRLNKKNSIVLKKWYFLIHFSDYIKSRKKYCHFCLRKYYKLAFFLPDAPKSDNPNQTSLSPALFNVDDKIEELLENAEYQYEEKRLHLSANKIESILPPMLIFKATSTQFNDSKSGVEFKCPCCDNLCICTDCDSNQPKSKINCKSGVVDVHQPLPAILDFKSNIMDKKMHIASTFLQQVQSGQISLADIYRNQNSNSDIKLTNYKLFQANTHNESNKVKATDKPPILLVSNSNSSITSCSKSTPTSNLNFSNSKLNYSSNLDVYGPKLSNASSSRSSQNSNSNSFNQYSIPNFNSTLTHISSAGKNSIIKSNPTSPHKERADKYIPKYTDHEYYDIANNYNTANTSKHFNLRVPLPSCLFVRPLKTSRSNKNVVIPTFYKVSSIN